MNTIKNAEGYLVGKDDSKLPDDLTMAFDVSGSQEGANLAVKMMDYKGKVCLIGWSLGERTIDLNTVVLKEIMMRGSSNFTYSTYKKVAIKDKRSNYYCTLLPCFVVRYLIV